MNIKPIKTWPGNRAVGMFLLVLGLLAVPGRGQEPPPIEWTVGPGRVSLGTVGALELPAGYRFTGAAGAKTWLELNGNPGSGTELGVVVPPLEQMENPETGWFMVWNFSEVGYVKDEEKTALTGSGADAILESLRQGTSQSNLERQRRGWPELTLLGWYQAPFYDSATHHLTWAIRCTSAGSEVVNYDSRVLGRRGVMQVKMVVAPRTVAATVPTYRMILSGLTFTSGESYAEFRPGDKTAQLGLVALVTGGTAVATFKLWKPLLALGAVIVAALGAGMRKLKALLTPRTAAATIAPPPGQHNVAGAPDSALMHCPGCGQANRVTQGKAGAHCGHCGRALA